MDASVVVVGAGIAGVTAAFQLTVEHGADNVVLIDPRPPLTLTSDKSTECYRNWWPNQPMVGLMNRSIDILEGLADASNNTFGLSRRGYLFVTANPDVVRNWQTSADQISQFGGGEVRTHHNPEGYQKPNSEGYRDQPDGIDILIGNDTIRAHYPYLTNQAIAALHVRRAGWFSAQQFGSWLLTRATDAGLRHLGDEIVDVRVEHDSIAGVLLKSGRTISCTSIVNAAGPFAGNIARMANVDLPLKSEVHLKVVYRDHRDVVPRDAPMVIWSDPQTLDWSEDERAGLADAGRTDLLGEMPVFCHGRPEGGSDSPYFLALWEYHNDVREPTWPLPVDHLYPEVVARGLTTMMPGMGQYLVQGLPQTSVDGGYYTKTPENRPLIGPAGPKGFFLACGYSGFGVMVAPGAADLVARHVVGIDLPEYAPDFLLSRYDDPTYLASIRSGVESGQL